MSFVKHRWVKRLALLVCFLFVLATVVVCKAAEDKVIASLGKYESCQAFTSEGFQDYTDYAKYDYKCAAIKDNPYLKQVQPKDISKMNRLLDDYEDWLKTIKESDPSSEVALNYDFDRRIVDTEDYIYFDVEEHTLEDGQTATTMYNIYFYDTQGRVLYYFHDNI